MARPRPGPGDRGDLGLPRPEPVGHHRPHLGEDPGPGGLRRAARDRRGVIFEGKLDGLGDVAAVATLDHPEGQIDAARDPAGRDEVAILDHPLGDEGRAEQGELMARSPVAAGATAPEKAGGSEDEGARAHARDKVRPPGLAAEPIEDLGIAHDRGNRRAPGDAEEVEPRARGERDRRHQGEATVARDGLERLPGEVELGTRHPREHLRRPGQVELGKTWPEQEADPVWC